MELQTSEYEGIYHNRGRWQIIWKKKYVGIFCTEKKAIEALMAHIGVTKMSALPKKTAGHRISPKARMERFQELHKIFHDFMPGDLEAAFEAFHQHSDMFADEPLLELLSLQGKIRPWKIALYEAWQELRNAPSSQLSSVPLDLNGRAEKVMEILRVAVQKMDGHCHQDWSDNCGRNNQFHSGWLAMMGPNGASKSKPNDLQKNI